MSAPEYAIVISADNLDDEVLCAGDADHAPDYYAGVLKDHDRTVLVELVAPDGAVVATDRGQLR